MPENRIDLNIKYSVPTYKVYEPNSDYKRVICTINTDYKDTYILHPIENEYVCRHFNEETFIFLLEQGYIQRIYSK